MIDPRLYIAAASLAVSFTAGWLVHGWKYDANRLADEKERANAYIEAVKKSDEASQKLQNVLSQLEKNRFVVTKELHHETTKLEYSNCLLPDSGRVLFNRSAESADTSKP